MATISLPNEADTWMNEHNQDTSYGSEYYVLTGGVTNYHYRALMRPDLSSLPANANISAVSLFMYSGTAGGADTSESTEYVYRLRRVFTENATWNDYDGSNSWTNDGAEDTSSDRYSTIAGSLTYSGYDKWIEIEIDPSEFTALIDGTNTGFIIQHEEDNEKQYFSREETDPVNPYWYITYSLGKKYVRWFS